MSSILIVEDEVLAFRRQATKRSQPAVRKKHKLMLDRESNRIPPAGARLLATGRNSNGRPIGADPAPKLTGDRSRI